MLISYVNGMGDKLVSGKVSGIDVVVTIDEDDFLIETPKDITLQDKLLLLAKESKQLEELLRYPLDIEWAIIEEDIYFLQCRPLASITGIASDIYPVNKQGLSKIPRQLICHDKIKLRLTAQESDIFISDAYVCIRNLCFDDLYVLDIPKSDFCKGYSAVIVYPQRLSNKVIRSFVGDKKKVFESIIDCCRYGIRSFPEYDNLRACLNGYFELLNDEYWVSTTIIQEIFDPVYTGVIQCLEGGYIIEITKGHFLTKGVVPTSQYIVSKEGCVIERTEIHQEKWLKIIEGHVVHCICNNGDETLVALSDDDVKKIIDSFSPILKLDSNVVISYGTISGKPIVINNFGEDSLNEHFHNISEGTIRSNEKIIFFCENPELAILKVIEQYEPKNIGFVFQNCAIGAHLAVVLREKGIPAIKVDMKFWKISQGNICTIDAKTQGLLPKERLQYE